ncbi:MAG: hypothetical protein AAF702_00355 [Chloroflexota bacterium]
MTISYVKATIPIILAALLTMLLMGPMAQAGSNNRAPILQSIPDQTIAVGERFAMLIRASDEDGDELTFNLASPPPGASLSERTNTEALFEWTPSRTGSFEIEFSVTDDSEPAGIDSQVVTIRVVERGSADISVNLAQAPSTASVGDEIKSTVVIENLSPVVVQNSPITVTATASSTILDIEGVSCDSTESPAQCTIDSLQGQDNQGSRKVVTITTQANVPSQQEYIIVMEPNGGDANYANNLVSWEVPVTSVIQDKVKIKLTRPLTSGQSSPLNKIQVVVKGQYGGVPQVTHVVTGTTDRTGTFIGTLPKLNFDSIQTSASLTETAGMDTSTIDFTFNINNMPATGVLTTSIGNGDENSSVRCNGLTLWQQNGDSVAGDCASSTGHSWNRVTTASHAAFSGRLVTTPPLVGSANHANQSEPLNLMIEIVSITENEIFVPLLLK